MSLKTRIKLAAAALRGVLTLDDSTGWENILGGKTKSGVIVNSNTSMKLSAVFGCVRKSSEVISTLPVHTFRKNPDGSRSSISHPVESLLSRAPNPEMPANVFREVLQGHIELRGRAYAEIVRDGRWDPVELWPIHPDKMRPVRNSKNELRYEYIPTGQFFPPESILDIRGLGSTGLDAYSILSLARESIGLGLSAQEYGARFFGEGTNIGGFLKHPGKLKDETFDRLKVEMDNKYKGLQKSHSLIILEDGLDFQKVGLTNNDAQFLETRKFQVTDIARWFGMPPHMVGDLEKATFSNIEHMGIEAVAYTWLPRVTRWEMEINMKLFKPNEYVKFGLEGLLRGDIKSRYEAYQIAVQNGWLNADEVRALEDMNPQADGQGKINLVPLNMMNKKYLLAAPSSATEKKNSAQLPFLRLRQNMTEFRTRQLRGVDNRRTIAERYRKKIRTAADELVKKENDYILSGTEKKNSSEAVTNWLNSEYDFADEIRNIIGPTFSLMATDLYPFIADELGLDADEPPQKYRTMVDEYISSFALRHSLSSRNQLKAIMTDASDDFIEVLEQRLSEWEDRRPGKIEQNETTRTRNFFTKAGYIVGGVTLIRSVAHGKSCPYCLSIDGKVIGIEQNFLKKGDSLEPEGADAPMNIKQNMSHPPYHGGCDCDIAAEG